MQDKNPKNKKDSASSLFSKTFSWVKKNISIIRGLISVFIGLYIIFQTGSIVLNFAFFILGVMAVAYGLSELKAFPFGLVFLKLSAFVKKNFK